MLVSAAWVCPAALGAINVVAQRRLSGAPAPGLPAILFASGDWLLYAFLTPAVFAFARRWPLSRPHLARNALRHLAISLLFCAAWAGAGTALKQAVMPGSMEGGAGAYFITCLFITLPFGVALYLPLVAFAHPIQSFP